MIYFGQKFCLRKDTLNFLVEILFDILEVQDDFLYRVVPPVELVLGLVDTRISSSSDFRLIYEVSLVAL